MRVARSLPAFRVDGPAALSTWILTLARRAALTPRRPPPTMPLHEHEVAPAPVELAPCGVASRTRWARSRPISARSLCCASSANFRMTRSPSLSAPTSARCARGCIARARRCRRRSAISWTAKARMDVDEKLDAEAEALLSALEAGELDGAARAEAEALLVRSPAARATYDRSARLRAVTGALPDPLLPSAARRRVGEALLAALDAGRRRRALPRGSGAGDAGGGGRAAGAGAVAARAGPGRRRAAGAHRPRRTPTVAARRPRHCVRRRAQRRRRSTAARRCAWSPAACASSCAATRIIRGPSPPPRRRRAPSTAPSSTSTSPTTRPRCASRAARSRCATRSARARCGPARVARARVGAAPRRIEHIVPIVLEGTPEIEERPR